MQFNTLEFEELIVHRVPGRGDSETDGPILSEAATSRDPRVFGFFRQRLSGVMARKGLPIEPDTARIAADAKVGTTIESAASVIDDPSTFVACSQRIAQRLWDTQDRRNSAGILVVARGKIDSLPCVGILKLEHERGIQAEQETNDDGQLTFKVILHDDLLLTDTTAVFKGVILRRSADHGDVLEAEASDLQNPRESAGIFIKQFLGCKLVDDPAEATRKYFSAAETFINAEVVDPEKRAQYEGALLAAMNSSVQTIDPDRFARDNLDASEHQPFLDHLKAQDANVRAFAKDTARIKARIRRVAYGFKSGIKLVGQPEAMDEHVDIDHDAERTKVTITDQLTRMNGAS